MCYYSFNYNTLVLLRVLTKCAATDKTPKYILESILIATLGNLVLSILEQTGILFLY